LVGIQVRRGMNHRRDALGQRSSGQVRGDPHRDPPSRSMPPTTGALRSAKSTAGPSFCRCSEPAGCVLIPYTV
jgi:hypothetical protein